MIYVLLVLFLIGARGGILWFFTKRMFMVKIQVVF